MKELNAIILNEQKITRPLGKWYQVTGIAIFVIALLAGCATPQPIFSESNSDLFAKYSRIMHGKKKYKIGIDRGKRAVGYNQKNGSAWYWLGENYLADKQFDEANKAFKEVIKLNQSKNQVITSYYNLGLTLHNQYKFKEAIRYLSLGIDSGPKYPYFSSTYFYRTDSYLYLGMYDKSLQDASFSLQHKRIFGNKNFRVNIYISRAFAHLGLGEPEVAISLLRQAEQINPDFNRKNILGWFYYATNNRQKLKALYKNKGWLGVEMKNYANNGINAIQIVSTVKGSPALFGGLLKNDVITNINEKPVRNTVSFLRIIGGLAPESTVRLKIVRGKIEKILEIKLGSIRDRAALRRRLASSLFIAPLLAKNKMFAPAVAAENKGQYRKAFQLYQKASRSDSEIIGRIIKLYHKLDPAPAIPQEARKHAIFAATATKIAKNNRGYDQAIKEYYTVTRLAPWVADPYVNLALLLEKRERYVEATTALKHYLLAAPNAKDAKIIQTKIYELEYQANNLSAK